MTWEFAGVADEVKPAIRNSVKLPPFEKAFGAIFIIALSERWRAGRH